MSSVQHGVPTHSAQSTGEPAWLRRTLIAIALLFVATFLILPLAAVFTEALRKAILHGQDGEKDERCVELWTECSLTLKAELATEKQRTHAAKMLGGLAAAEDAAEMALLMSAGREIVVLQDHLPKPIPTLTEDDICFLREIFDRLTVSMPDVAPYIPLVVMGRLQRPWEALHLAGALSRQMTDTLISNTDVGVVGELLFSDLDEYAKKIQAVRPFDFDPQVLVTQVATFSELSSGIVRELGIRRDGKWGQRLGKCRTIVSETLDSLLERGPKEILAALPAAKTGGFGKSLKPLDLSRKPDPDRVAKAMRYANLMVHSRPFSVAAAFHAKLTETTDEITGVLRTYAEDVLKELRAGPSEARPHIEEYWDIILSLCGLILGEEETEFLRRRSKVSTSAAASA